MRLDSTAKWAVYAAFTVAFVGGIAVAGSSAELAQIAPRASAAVAQIFPGAAVLGYGEETEGDVAFYEVKVEFGDRQAQVEVTADGRVGEIESVVPAEGLPQPVRATLTRLTEGGSVTEIEKHEVRGVPRRGTFEPVVPPAMQYEVSYVIDGARRQRTIGQNGELLAAESDDDGGDDDAEDDRDTD